LKIHANINNPISASNVRESPQFPHLKKIGVEKHDGRIMHVQLKICSITLI